MYGSIYYISRRWMKTQLEVQANRLCNVVTLSDYCNSDDAPSPARAKCDQTIWMILNFYEVKNASSEA